MMSMRLPYPFGVTANTRHLLHDAWHVVARAGRSRGGADRCRPAHARTGIAERGYRVGSPFDVGRERTMGLILFVLVLALLFGGLGFAVHALWIIAVVLLLLWILGFLMRGAEGARWYRW